MDNVLAILKIGALVATGVFAATALLTKYRDDTTKEITRWGKIALGGIVVSFLISLGVYVIEAKKAQEKAETDAANAEKTANRLAAIFETSQTTVDKQTQSLADTDSLKTQLAYEVDRSQKIAKGMEDSLVGQRQVLGGNEKILGGVTDSIKQQDNLLALNTGTLREVSRGLYPLRDLKASYEIGLSMHDKALEGYVKRFHKELPSFVSNIFSAAVRSTLRAIASDRRDRVQGFSFGGECPLAPRLDDEPIAHDVFSAVDLLFQFQSAQGTKQSPDLTILASSKFATNSPLKADEHLANYDIESDAFTLEGRNVAMKTEYDPTGNIISVPDLMGATMTISVRLFLYGNEREEVDRIRAVLDILFLSISVSGRRPLNIPGSRLRKVTEPFGDGHHYVFQFPTTYAGMKELEH